MFLGICCISIAQALVNSERTTDRTISRKSSHQITKYTSLNLDSFVLKGGNRATLGSAWSQGHLLLQWATCPYDEANWCWSRWLQMAITVPLILGICAYVLMVYYVDGCIYDQENVERVQNALASGHQVASHTWTHPHLPQLSYDQGTGHPMLQSNTDSNLTNPT